jgi:hypothetical protein
MQMPHALQSWAGSFGLLLGANYRYWYLHFSLNIHKIKNLALSDWRFSPYAHFLGLKISQNKLVAKCRPPESGWWLNIDTNSCTLSQYSWNQNFGPEWFNIFTFSTFPRAQNWEKQTCCKVSPTFSLCHGKVTLSSRDTVE